MIQAMPIGIFAKDAKNEFQFTIWNEGMRHIFGVSGEELLGKTDFDLFYRGLMPRLSEK